MRYLPIIMLFGVTSCTSQRLAMLGDEEIRQMLCQVRVESADPSMCDLTPWLAHKTVVRREVGRWLPGRPPTVLVTIEVLNASHAGGQTHHIVAVADSTTGKFITPAYHYVSDTTNRHVLRAESQDVLLYQGFRWQQHVRKDRSFLIRFSERDVISDQPIGTRDPDTFFFMVGGHGRFWIEKQQLQGWPEKVSRKTTETIWLQWNAKTMEFDPIINEGNG